MTGFRAPGEIELTNFPSEIDSPESLMRGLAELRNKTLKQGDFQSAVLLSHIHVWLHWLNENWDELKEHA